MTDPIRQQAEAIDAKVQAAISAVRCDGSTPVGSFAAIIESALRACAAEARQAQDQLRAALVGLVGVDTREELEAMEGIMRLATIPAADKATTIDALHALLATLPPPPARADAQE